MSELSDLIEVSEFDPVLELAILDAQGLLKMEDSYEDVPQARDDS